MEVQGLRDLAGAVAEGAQGVPVVEADPGLAAGVAFDDDRGSQLGGGRVAGEESLACSGDLRRSRDGAVWP